MQQHFHENVFIYPGAKVRGGVHRSGLFWYTHGGLIRVGVTRMGELEHYPTNVSDDL